MIRVVDPALVDSWVKRDFPEAESLAYVLSDTNNICLSEGEGGVIFVWRGPGIYECHCFLEQRGKTAIKTVQSMFAAMRRNYGAERFWCAIPDDARKVKIFVRWLGWRSRGAANLGFGPCELFIGE